MNILDCAQGTEEWYAARLAIPTASRFDRIITATGKASSQSNDYLYELLAEHITGERKEIRQTDDMLRGIEREPQARAYYELETAYDVTEVGGIFLDDTRSVMCSPDGIIPEIQRGIEIKSPRLENHIRNCLEQKLPTQYVLQVQGAMWITGYDTWDFISYCPEYTSQPLMILTIKRDEKLIEAMDKHIRAFSKKLEAYKKEVNNEH
ncbi:lambda exonuclease family protein [Suttonella ornithocola]|uniref:Putative phage-type endonuclease n=1 Tax=Suttonella ornithocola TaxID=279832 RepID=A0A380MTE7_9GAMM|nr:lambda exonuclease family protein [Suttonella ornithocola]SUO95193.1 putative phage-type endonuclease [Suttonella ornithocola]SUQ09758.1 putative phage-type endonuclease [Suttonella ornithocola]